MKISRLIAPLTSLAALVALLVVLVGPATGASQRSVTSSQSDRYLFGRDAVIEQPVTGNVQVWGGNVLVEELIEGDLFVFGGDITMRGRGRVTGNVIYVAGRVNGLDDRVGGKVFSLATLEGAKATLSNTAVQVSLLLVWLLVAVVVTLMNGREVRASSVEVRVSLLHCLALGLVALTSFFLTAIVFSYLVPYVVGIPLLAALAVFAILAKVYGMIAVFHAVGNALAGAKTREQLTSRKWFRGDVAMVVLGLVILGAIRLVPVVGPLTWQVASVFGVGVALATKFGRREPWFLVWRPSAA